MREVDFSPPIIHGTQRLTLPIPFNGKRAVSFLFSSSFSCGLPVRRGWRGHCSSETLLTCSSTLLIVFPAWMVTEGQAFPLGKSPHALTQLLRKVATWVLRVSCYSLVCLDIILHYRNKSKTLLLAPKHASACIPSMEACC